MWIEGATRAMKVSPRVLEIVKNFDSIHCLWGSAIVATNLFTNSIETLAGQWQETATNFPPRHSPPVINCLFHASWLSDKYFSIGSDLFSFFVSLHHDIYEVSEASSWKVEVLFKFELDSWQKSEQNRQKVSSIVNKIIQIRVFFLFPPHATVWASNACHYSLL